MARGYFGIGIEGCKNIHNVGMLWRSAHCLGAAYIFTIGERYKHKCDDTTKAWKSIPLFRYPNLEDFYVNLPHSCMLVGVEFPHEKALPLPGYSHPERAVYLLGSEDNGLSQKALGLCHSIVYIPSKICMNVAATGSIVMFDRNSKRNNK